MVKNIVRLKLKSTSTRSMSIGCYSWIIRDTTTRIACTVSVGVSTTTKIIIFRKLRVTFKVIGTDDGLLYNRGSAYGPGARRRFGVSNASAYGKRFDSTAFICTVRHQDRMQSSSVPEECFPVASGQSRQSARR